MILVTDLHQEPHRQGQQVLCNSNHQVDKHQLCLLLQSWIECCHFQCNIDDLFTASWEVPKTVQLGSLGDLDCPGSLSHANEHSPVSTSLIFTYHRGFWNVTPVIVKGLLYTVVLLILISWTGWNQKYFVSSPPLCVQLLFLCCKVEHLATSSQTALLILLPACFPFSCGLPTFFYCSSVHLFNAGVNHELIFHPFHW